MTNLSLSLLAIGLCAGAYLLSLKYWLKKSNKTAIFFLLVAGLVLRAYVSSDLFLHHWDERYHAVVAKNMMRNPIKPTLYRDPVLPYEYIRWNKNHIWLHKQPMALWAMASSMWVFGVNEIALRLPSVLLSVLGIWLLYLIGIYFFNRQTAYIAAFLFSLNNLIIELAGGRVSTDNIDVFFLFFIELAVFFSVLFAQRQKTIFNVLAGISIGLAVLSKWLPAFIVFPIWIILIYDSGNFKPKSLIINFIILLLISICVFLPWQLYIFDAFPLEANWESDYNYKHLTDDLEGLESTPFYFAGRLRREFGELVYLPLIWFFWKTFKDLNLKNLRNLTLIVWFAVPFLFFSLVKTKMPAYILFTFPAILLMIADFIVTFYKKINDQTSKWMIYAMIMLIFALQLKSTYRIFSDTNYDRNPSWVSDLKKLNERKIAKGVLFNYQHPVEAMFYTDLIAYPDIPEEKTIRDLIKRNYVVLIHDDGNIAEKLKSVQLLRTENDLAGKLMIW